VSAWWSSPLVVGHRGGRGEGWPAENTLAAFAQARGQGARAIELDVRTCADGAVVVFHDDTLERMTRGRDKRRVDAISEEELARIELGAPGGKATAPSLDEVLDWARSQDVAVNVEMKHDVPARLALVRATVEAVRSSRADVFLSSFDPVLLAMSRALAPAIPGAFLTEAQQPRWARLLQESARPALVRGLHLERTQADAGAFARYRRRGLRIGVWTVNDPAEARELVRLGAASIITDHPGEILAAL
jgi:glycerophosphoryl diester phosphodiesterase